MVAHLQIGTSSIMSHRIGSWKCWFLRRRENWTAVAGEKPLGARNQHQTQPCTYGGAGIGWVLSPVGHACTPAPNPFPMVLDEILVRSFKSKLVGITSYVNDGWCLTHFSRFAHDGATLCLRTYLSSSVMLSQELSFSHWVQGLSIWPSLSNTYKINKQSSWLTVLAAY